jgi:type IV pilus assembly protein PilO
MALVVGAIWYAGKIYLLDPKGTDIAFAQQQLDDLELKNRRARAEAARQDDLRTRMEVQERQLRIFEELIPQSEEVPELLDAISQQARQTGVELSRIRPQASEIGEYYTKQTWELSVKGEYHDIGRYLGRIASLPRIIKPGSIQLSPAPRSRATRDMEAPLEVSFVVETFVLGAQSGAGSEQGASR